MKKLLGIVIPGLLLCNVGFAESYVCKDNETTTNTVGTYIMERHSQDQFSLRLINKDRRIYFDIYFEDLNAIILIAKPSDTSGVATIILDKNDLTYGGSQIFHPFDNYDVDDYTSGKCDKIN